MKRDYDFIRQIVLELEASDETVIIPAIVSDEAMQDEKLFYHVQLLQDAQLMKHQGNGQFRLTNQGHDFVEAIKSETIWKKTKDGALSVSGMTLAMVKDLAIAYLKQEAKKKLGIDL